MKKLKNLLRKNKNKIQEVVVSILIILNLFIFLKPNLYLNQLSGKTPLLDFDSYLVMVESAKKDLNPYISEGMVTLGPPPVLLYFYPFSYLGIEFGRSLTTLLNMVCGTLLCFLLARNYFPKKQTISFLTFLILLFSSFPVRFSIGMGQPELLMALLITYIIIKKRQSLNGFLLAALSIVKSFFLVSFLAFLKKDRKHILNATFILAIVVLLTFFFIKPEWYLYYFTNNFTKLFSTQFTFIWPDYYNQSLGNFLYRLNIGSLYQFLFLPLALSAGTTIFLTSNFAFSVVAATILSPVSWQHYYVVFFPIFIMLFAVSKKTLKNLLPLFISFLLWWIEFPWLHHANMNLINGILASHYFISGLMLSFLLLKRK